MTTFTRHSERVPPQGAAAGDVAERALGRHEFSPWELLVRETFQNSWDARSDQDHGHIEYRVDLFKATGAQCALLGSRIFADLSGPQRGLSTALLENNLELLIVSDSGTRGLGGPTRGDLKLAEGERADFADFVLHIGRAAEKEVGGGTFGFGKAVFPLASQHGTCLVYTQMEKGGVIEKRLIAFGIGKRYSAGDEVYTGRHWWGVEGEISSHVDPLTGEEAAELAEGLGLRTMGDHRTGTSVAVLGPELYGEERTSVAEQLSRAALRWIWPHLVDRGDGAGPNARAVFTVDGFELPQVDPMKDPVMQYFVRTLRDAEEVERTRMPKDGLTSSAKPIVYGARRRHAGSLALHKYPSIRVPDDEPTTHHVALMRKPRLVVQYLEVAEPGPDQALAGVFIATDALDEVFAKAEPPAHDVWRAQGVVGAGEDNPVRLAQARIQEACKPVVASADPGTGEGRLSGIANVARRLGALFGGVGGPGAELQELRPSGRAGGGAGRGGRTWHPTIASVELRRGENGPEVEFVVPVPADVASDTSIRAIPRVVIHGGADEVPGSDTERMPGPKFVGWFDEAGELLSTATELPAEHVVRGNSLRVRITQPRMTAVRVDLKGGSH